MKFIFTALHRKSRTCLCEKHTISFLSDAMKIFTKINFNSIKRRLKFIFILRLELRKKIHQVKLCKAMPVYSMMFILLPTAINE